MRHVGALFCAGMACILCNVLSSAEKIMDVVLETSSAPDFLVTADLICESGVDVEDIIGSVLEHTFGTWELVVPVDGCSEEIASRSVAAVGRWLKTSYTGRLTTSCPSGLVRASVTRNETLNPDARFTLNVRVPVREPAWNEWITLPLVLFDSVAAVEDVAEYSDGETRDELDARRAVVQPTLITGWASITAFRGTNATAFTVRYGSSGQNTYGREVPREELSAVWARIDLGGCRSGAAAPGPPHDTNVR